MLNSPGDSDRIDGYSIYLNDDAGDVYWQPETTVTNLGYVEFGADNGTRTIAGKITDGTDPHCTEVASPNYLKKVGSGTVTLGNTNTYTLYTDIAGGTLQSPPTARWARRRRRNRRSICACLSPGRPSWRWTPSR
jgi:autotransporter-associated beta strand protein